MRMETKNAFRVALATLSLIGTPGHRALGQVSSAEPDTLAFRILKWSGADQTSWINATLDKGLPPELGDVLGALIVGRSSLTLPLIEQRVEQVLHAKSPSECFTDRSVNPEKFAYLAADSIAYAGNDEAMRQVAKLIKLDRKRFDDLVVHTLMATENRGNPENKGNPYIVAYHGLEIGEPLVDERVYAWAQARLTDKTEFRIAQVRSWWAEAMVNRYGGVPTESQWVTDPFVSRMNPSDQPALRGDLMARAIVVVEQRQKR
jgi:hypothetical protein